MSNFKCIGVNQQPIEQRDCFFQHLSIKSLIGQLAVGAVWFIISSLLQDVLASRSIITSVHVEWAKSCTNRFTEEVWLVLEEMKRVELFLWYEANHWGKGGNGYIGRLHLDHAQRRTDGLCWMYRAMSRECRRS